MNNKTGINKTNQTDAGKAFEYFLALTLYNKINNGQQVTLENNESFKIAKECFNKFNEEKQQNYENAAEAAVNFIVKLEPRLEYPISNGKITIIIQADSIGRIGDTRDVITVRSRDNWEIGFSAKNNHTAVKHPRISDTIDFGKSWFGISCSPEYMIEIRKIFGKVRKMIKESNRTLLWKEIESKKNEIYTKVLESFKTEIQRLYDSNSNLPERLFKYLIGEKDFYKVIKMKKHTAIQAFNLNGKLNNSSKLIKPEIKISKTKIPTKIVAYSNLIGYDTIKINFDKGWVLSFRIHNASSKLEPSLKFDIQFEGNPEGHYTWRFDW